MIGLECNLVLIITVLNVATKKYCNLCTSSKHNEPNIYEPCESEQHESGETINLSPPSHILHPKQNEYSIFCHSRSECVEPGKRLLLMYEISSQLCLSTLLPVFICTKNLWQKNEIAKEEEIKTYRLWIASFKTNL